MITVLVLCIGFFGVQTASALTIEVIGAEQVSVVDILETAAEPADPHPEVVQMWADATALRIKAMYAAKGYSYARVFMDLSQKGVVRIEIDEGVMHNIYFVGTNLVSGVMLHVDFDLPNNVFHKEKVTRSLETLRLKYGLHKLSYRVRNREDKRMKTRTGKIVSMRELAIYVTQHERLGWSFGVSVQPITGITPTLGFRLPNTLVKGDRAYGEIAFGIPYREYLFDEQPEFQWVHGRTMTGYRFRPSKELQLAPTAQISIDSTVYRHTARRIERYVTSGSEVLVGFTHLFKDWLTLTTWVGADRMDILDVEMELETEDAPPALSRVRGLLRMELELERASDLVRLDQRRHLKLQMTIGGKGMDYLSFDSRLQGQWVYNFGFDQLLVRGQAVYMSGDLRFWDEALLTGDYHRVFFEDRYRVLEALQLQSEYRFSWNRDYLKFGMFFDASGFLDRRDTEPVLCALLGAGPSMHMLLFDYVQLDVYYGMGVDVGGVDPLGFTHNLFFLIQNIH